MSMLSVVGLVLAAAVAGDAGARGDGPSAAVYPSIQAAVDANPGRMVYVPPGDYTITRAIRIGADRTGLFGPGRVVQADAGQPILVIEGASDVQVRDLTLTRAEGAMETESEGVLAIECREIVLDNLRVLDNRTRSAAVALRRCAGGQVRNCVVRNYQRVSVDDRTDSPEYGFAFRCVAGTGVLVGECRGILVQGCRVVERRIVPTPELAREFDLGRYVKKNPTRGRLAGAADWERGSTHNWSQATAIHVANPESTDMTQVVANFIENTGQGIDVHADHVIIAQNLVNDTLIGMKAMHGSRNVLIQGNQFTRSALWSIGLMPGTASHGPRPAEGGGQDVAANVDGGSIIASNIISDFGYGHYAWIWGEPGANGFPIRFDIGQRPDNPPLADVVVQGNIVYDTGRDGVIEGGKPRVVPPRYQYAVLVEKGAGEPRGLHFSGNILHPGTRGVSNVELRP
jgi:hypothetical protein